MNRSKRPHIALLVIYILLSVIILAGIIFAAGGTFDWTLIIKLERLIVKEHFDFDIVVWGYWMIGVSVVLLVAILLIEDNFISKKTKKEIKHKYKF